MTLLDGIRDDDWIGDLHALDEGTDYVRATLIDGRSDDNDALVSMGQLESVQFRDFLSAGRAPGRPEIKDDNLAEKIGRIDWFAIQVRHRPGGGWPVPDGDSHEGGASVSG